MKTNIYLCAVTFLSLVFCSPAYAQLIELNTEQNFTVSFPGFFPFSSEANESFKELLSQNKSVAVIISDFSGGKLKVAPAADNREIGKKKVVKGNTTVALAFTKKGKLYGLSFVPKGSVNFTLEVQPFAGRPCPNPVNCQDDCGENLGKCCEKDANGNQSKICVQVGLSSCGCANR